MDIAQDMSGQDQDGLADKVMESVGQEPEESTEEQSPESTDSSGNKSNDPLYVQKRLKQQKRAHEREMREMQARIADMQSRLSQQQPAQSQMMNPTAYGQTPDSDDERIRRAVSLVLNQKDMEERKAQEAQHAAHVNKQYRELQKHLDSMSDKYDDFHDVVFGDDAQYTPSMRDFSMTLPKTGKGSAGEVLYKLGKNPEELNRIAKLHPLDQATEMMKLSHALISGGDNKVSSSRPLGQIKTNPVSTSATVTEKTPIGSIRERMKAGTWK